MRDTQNNVDILDETGYWPGPRERQYDSPDFKKFHKINWVDELGLAQDGSEEGVVFCFYHNGITRVKMKVEEYKRLHYLMTNTSEKTVWEALSNGTFDQMIEDVPDEFYNMVLEWEEGLIAKYDKIDQAAISDWHNAFAEGSDRKFFAQAALKSEYKDILFRIYDGRTYDDLIWKRVKP